MVASLIPYSFVKLNQQNCPFWIFRFAPVPSATKKLFLKKKFFGFSKRLLALRGSLFGLRKLFFALFQIAVYNSYHHIRQLLYIICADCRLKMTAADAAVVREERVGAARLESHCAKEILG